MVSAKETAEAYINDNPVMVFSKTYCPYCQRTKKLLAKKQEEIGFKYQVLELDTIDEGYAIQDALRKRDGHETVPNVYIMKKHIGGNDAVQKMGPELDEKLKEAAHAGSSDQSIPESS